MMKASTDVQRLPPGELHWHQHPEPYLAIVLEGSYEECGDHGRLWVEPGDAVLHLPFDRHSNSIGKAGAKIVNVNLSIGQSLAIHDVPQDLSEILAGQADDFEIANVRPVAATASRNICNDEADALALALMAGATQPLERLAAEYDVRERTLRRRFQRLYGMSAAKFRARARARRAFREILSSQLPLASIAFDHGFSDQAHMSRAVTALTGSPPTFWRRSWPFDSRRSAVQRPEPLHVDRLSNSCCPDRCSCSGLHNTAGDGS